MVHDFRGPIDMIEPWTRAGFFLSVSPRAARRPGPVLTAIPGRSLLIETDDEGPDALAAVIDALAAARRVPAATVIAQTAENFAALVGR
jgi:Tat protein secretion system quality control protein TatD with DNase activity